MFKMRRIAGTRDHKASGTDITHYLTGGYGGMKHADH